MSKSIDEYGSKRDFSKTPEPKPEQQRKTQEAALEFVVHRHDASRLHYDLRLEMDGVLRSWAVPKGLSYNPDDKRLAVQTEDHPFEYLEFEGVIPKGEYGAGTMTIWDRGRYRFVNKSGFDGVANGKIEIALSGRRLRGEWHMVLTKGGGTHEWLLFKARDLYSRGPDEAAGGDLRDAVEAEMQDKIRPMKPSKKVDRAFSDHDWIFEMVFEGMRVQLNKSGEKISIAASTGRGKKNLIDSIPEFERDLQKLRAANATLDGVLVALDENGRPSLESLAERLRGDSDTPVQLYAFDLLYFEEFDTRAIPLVERKAQLASIIPRSKSLLYVDHVPGSGEGLARAVRQSGLHGIMAKRSDSAYESGRSSSWIEIEIEPDLKARKKEIATTLSSGNGEYKPTDKRIKFTNLKKVYWPDQGYTKGDLLGYYEQVADLLLPYLEDRPCHLLRYPDGVDGQSFYQHEAPGHLPEWFETEPIPSESKGRDVPHMICNHRACILYLVNLGSIDLHPWMSRRPTLDSPDYTILDLDPKEASFSDVIRVARAIKKILDAIGVVATLKTSGKSGLHIHIPLQAGYNYDQGRMFAEGVARVVVKEHPEIATIERATANRKSRVYVDYMQNRGGQTVVPPYVARPIAAATVSTPLHWDELDADLDPGRYTLRTVLQRISRHGDLFRPSLEVKQDMVPAIAALQEYLKG